MMMPSPIGVSQRNTSEEDLLVGEFILVCFYFATGGLAIYRLLKVWLIYETGFLAIIKLVV